MIKNTRTDHFVLDSDPYSLLASMSSKRTPHENKSVPLPARWLITLFWFSSASGQTVTGSIAGVVTDPSGAVVLGAKVVCENTATGVKTSVQTNSDGVYTLRGGYTRRRNWSAPTFLPRSQYSRRLLLLPRPRRRWDR